MLEKIKKILSSIDWSKIKKGTIIKTILIGVPVLVFLFTASSFLKGFILNLILVFMFLVGIGFWMNDKSNKY